MMTHLRWPKGVKERSRAEADIREETEKAEVKQEVRNPGRDTEDIINTARMSWSTLGHSGHKCNNNSSSSSSSVVMTRRLMEATIKTRRMMLGIDIRSMAMI